ncbi:MAG: DUF11 domain-containing protein [Thermoplasmata archaeon]|nr:MAG: DUF11 domain-containing protein [Thermoplasmata archaeon]
MRGKGKGVLAVKKANSIVVMTLLVIGTLVLAVTPPGEEPDHIEDWPDESEWINYTFRGERIRDWEDKPYENDPTHGIANVQPDAVDIASGVDASGGGAENNPGNFTSVQYVYKDVNGDSVGCENIEDDWLFLRMRVAGDPRATGGKYMYKAYHWDILIEVDGDLWSEFVVDLNGGDGYFKWGTVGVYYNNTEDYEYDPDNDWVWLQEASKAKNKFTRPVLIDYGTDTEDDDQWWIEYRIPVTAFTDYDDNQLLCSNTGFLLFFSTSASLTNPLQKDWMGEYIFGQPANITVEKTVEEGTVAPGDTLHYKIYYNNTGDFNANHVWVNDTIPEYTTFLDCSPAYDSVDDRTYRWYFTDVEPGNYTIYLNVTVDAGVPDGTILRNVVALNYTDHQDNELPGSEDETENPVEGPDMTFTKEADSSTANPGDTLTYTLTYENTGSGGAYNVVITDTLPDYVELDYSDPAPTSEVGNILTWEFDVVPGNSVNYIYIYVIVDPYTEDGTYLVNYATLEYEDVNENLYPSLEDWANVTVTAPMMTISKTADVAEADPGDYITYTIEYENTGSGDATDVVIVDTIDPDTTFVNATPAQSIKVGDVITWNIGTVSGGGSGTIILIVKVDAYVEDGIILRNTVTLNYNDANGNPQDEESDYVDVTVTAPDMTISKTADKTEANPGDQITYTIEYENTGTGDATDVVIVDTIDPDTTFVSASPSPSSVVGDVITWNFGTVSGGGSGTITLIVEVDPYVEDGTVLTNTVTLNYDDANDNPQDEETDSVDVTVTAPGMTITKTADVSEADPGDYITYTISYENTGSGDATDVVIVDTIDPDTTFVNATPAPSSEVGDVLTWNIGTVSGGGSGIIILIVKVDAYVEDGTILRNTVTLNYDDANGNPQDEESDYVDVTVTAPDMTISKTADVSEADPGDQITYTIEYENTGTGDATDVVIVDTIHPDTTYVSATPAPSSIVGDVITWNLGTVSGGGSGSITLIVEVDAYVEDGTVLTNFVTLNYDDANGNPQDEETDSVDVTVTAPVMTISKTADVSEADPGDYITYTIEYENTGSGDATDVVIVDTIDPDTTFVNATPAPSSKVGDVITWNIGTVSGGDSGIIILIVKVDAYVEDGTILTNTVTLNYDDANGNPQDEETDCVKVTVTAPDMTISKTADVSEADPGDYITYTIEYENTGSGDATDVVIVDTIDPDTTYVNATPTPSSIVGDVITWNIGTIAGRDAGSFSLIVKVDAYVEDGTILRNTVTLNYDDANGNPQDEESDYVDVTVTAPDMTISKTANVSEADPGDYITYTIEYENTGSGDATDVVIVDTIDPDTTYVNATPAPSSIVGDVITWNIGLVAKETGGSIELIVKVDIGTPDGTLLCNYVTLNYDDANGNPQPEESDCADVTVTAPKMTFKKSADVTHADPGDPIVYTLTYENKGSGDATLVVVTDTIPSDVTYVSSNPVYDSVSGNTYTWNIGTVAGYSSGTITLTVKVNVGVADGTVLHNEATLDYADANGNYYPQLQDDADVTVTAPDMTITKTANVSEVDPGDTIVYTLFYENHGSGVATDVVVTDTIPLHTTFVISDPVHDSVSGRTYTWNIGTVAGYGSGTITINVTVDAGTPDQTVLRNDATLDYDDANGNPYPQETDYACVTVTAPEMSITKTANVETADPGDQITYTIVFENSGTGNATNVWINDTIPADTTYGSSSPTYDYNNGDTYMWYYALIGPGASVTISIVVKVDVGTPDKTLLHNSVTLDYADDNGNPLPQESDFANVNVTAPVMTIIKSADVSYADPGDTIEYTIEYENTGSGWASLVEIVDTIPADTTFLNSTPSPTSSAGDVYTWTIGDVAPGASGTITIIVTVDVGTADETLLHNVATLDYADANGNYYPQESDYADVIVTAPDLSIMKTANMSLANPGDTIEYTIEYENSGTGWASLVEIVDTIPADTTFVGSTPSPDSSTGDVYTWTIGDLAPGASGTITITVTVDVGTPDRTLLHNVVTLDYADANGNYYPQESDYADVVVTAPVMHISKTGPDSATPAEPIQYTITYSNTGSGLATLVEVVDNLPDYVTFVSATPAPTSVSGNTLTWEIGDVASGGSGTIVVNVKIDLVVPDGEELVNFVTLYYSDANGNPLPPERDSVTTTIEAGSIGDFVWHDQNMNALYDPSEPGVGGITVVLQGTTTYGDAVYLTTTTDSNGNYLFGGLGPGDYEVDLDLSWGWAVTTPHPIYVTLGIGMDYLDADFGIVKAEIEKTVSPDVAKIGNILHVHLWVKNPFDSGEVVDTLPWELEYIGNAIDDDGDGLIDEERQDGLDNDGDTLIDEDVGNFLFDGNYITGGLSLDGNKVIYQLPGKGIFTIDFDIIVVVDPEGEKYVTNLAEIIVDDEVMAYDTYTILIRYSGFDKYFLPINDPQPPPEPGEIVVDGSTPGYFFDYGDGDGIIEVGELIFWVVEYNITNKFNYTWTNVRMEDRWGGEYGVGGDGADNDNDGLIDEEAFNMMDDDGDGKIDEDIDVLWLSQGSVSITLRGTPPHSDKVYMYWDVGTLAPGETALLRLPVFTDRNPGDNVNFPQGHQSFSSPGYYIMNSGGVVKWLDERGKQHSAHTLRLYTNATNGGGDTATGVYSEPASVTGYELRYNPTLMEGESQTFQVELSNPSELGVTVFWYLDGEFVGQGPTFEFIAQEAGTYILTAKTAGEYHLTGVSLITVEAEEHTWTIQVLEDTDPQAVISSPPDGATFYENDEITFDGSSSYDLESAITYEWDLGDGFTSSLPTLTYSYENEGDYIVTLTVTDSKVQSGTSYMTIHIVARMPTAIIDSPTMSTFYEGDTIYFSGHATYPGDESTLTYIWDFGHGNLFFGKTIDYTFSDDGVYTVSFTVKDSEGHMDTVFVYLTILNVDPEATIDAPLEAEVEETVHFNAEASDPGDDTLTYEWNFGDGSSAYGKTVTHEYLASGQYEVTLTVRDEDGGQSVITTIITISDKPPSEPPIEEPDVPEDTPESGNEEPTKPEKPSSEPEKPPHSGTKPSDDPTKSNKNKDKKLDIIAVIPVYAILAAIVFAMNILTSGTYYQIRRRRF